VKHPRIVAASSVGGSVGALLAIYALSGQPDGAGSTAAQDREDEAFARLEQRPLRLPSHKPGEPCPLANAIQLPGVPTEGGLGPGNSTKRGLARLRRGPAYVAFPGVPRVLDFPPPQSRRAARDTRWRDATVLWASRPRYDGAVLVRGGDLDTRRRIRFGETLRPRLQLRLDAGPWVEDGKPLRVWDRTVNPGEGWRMASAVVRVRTKGPQSRCYAYQVDGKTFSYRMGFEVIVPDS
jgi:hypothetical protein